MLNWRPRRQLERRGMQLAGMIALAGILDVVAGCVLAYVAGFSAMQSVLSHPRWLWLAAMAGVLCVSFIGYCCAYRGIYRAEGGYVLPHRLLLAVVTAGFGGFFAHGGTTPDDLALQQAGADPRDSVVRAATLGGVEQGILAVAGAVASALVLCLRLTGPPPNTTLPWVIIPVPATIVACWAAARFAPSLREKGGWRGSVSMLLDSIRLARRLFERPQRYWLALGGMVVFWAADMFAVWAGLAAFGFAMDPAALVVGFCTGMVFTRRMAPMAGAGMLTLALSAALWYCGVPLPVAIAGTFAYRALTLWLPMPFGLAALPVLRQLGTRSMQARDEQGRRDETEEVAGESWVDPALPAVLPVTPAA